MIGKVLSNRYEIIEKVGSGGMAYVYKAKCRLLNRYVAIKILKDQYREDKEFVARFIRESQAAASLSNPNIVSVYDVGHDNDVNYIVLELVEGITLKDYIEKNGMMNWRQALNFSMKICSALTDAHRNGIIHRDIKPHNVIITPSGACKVTDFGIACISNINETRKVDEGILGSIHYISPEHAKGVIPDERSDIYSLGVTMYEMLTGTLPFDGDSAISIAIKHLNENPVPIKDINISVPLSLVNIVSKAMDKDINARYQSAKEMYAAMEKLSADPEMLITYDEEETTDLSDTIEVTKKQREEIKEILKEKKENEKEEAIPEEPKKKKKGFFADLFTIKDKKDKKAVVSAIIASVILILGVLTVCISIFFPSFGIGALFTRTGSEIEMPSLEGEVFAEMEEKYKKEMKFIVEEVFDNDYEEGQIITHEPLAGMTVKTPVRVTVQVSKGAKEVTVPNVVGYEIAEAKKVLSKEGLKFKENLVFDETVEEGLIIKQSPIANASAVAGDIITLTVSKGKDDEMIDMINLVGLTEAKAKAAVSEAELTIGAIIRKESDKAEGTVIEQSIPEGSQISKKTAINITVSKGKPKVDTPAPPPSNSDTPPHENDDKPVNSSFNLKLSLPTGKETVNVIVKQSGTTVYDKTVSTAQGTLTVPLYGMGTTNIEVYYDGQLIKTQKVSF